MTEMFQRVGTVTMIRIIIETWNEIFLVLLIAIMLLGARKDKNDELLSQVDIPMTGELIGFFILVFFYNLADDMSLCCGGLTTPVARFMMEAGVFLYYLMGALLTIYFLQVIKIHIANRNDDTRLARIISGYQLLAAPAVILLIATPFADILYSFTEDNLYQREWGFYLWQGFTLGIFLFAGILVFIYRKQADPFFLRIIAIAVVFPTVGFIMGMLSSATVYFNNTMVSISELIMFMLYEKNKTEVTLRYGYALEHAKTELAETKLTLMQAQIKPHFINNAMLAIQEVCVTDPEKASELIGHFARYLRNNIDATNSAALVPFEQEVQAIKEYLAIEYADPAKRFSFDFDLRAVDFSVPSLSIEPLAENAVKHGIDRYSESGRVVLVSYEDEEGFHVEVRDNGAGFDLNAETLGKGGIGLANAESRLQQMCGGRLDIRREDGWTVADITIPKKGKAFTPPRGKGERLDKRRMIFRSTTVRKGEVTSDGNSGN